MFKNISPTHIPQTDIQVWNAQIAPSNEEASRRYAKNIPSANIPKGMQAQLVRKAPSNVEGTPAIVIPQMGMQNGSVPSSVSVAQFLNKIKQ